MRAHKAGKINAWPLKARTWRWLSLPGSQALNGGERPRALSGSTGLLSSPKNRHRLYRVRKLSRSPDPSPQRQEWILGSRIHPHQTRRS
jgi:hypothetical protein